MLDRTAIGPVRALGAAMQEPSPINPLAFAHRVQPMGADVLWKLLRQALVEKALHQSSVDFLPIGDDHEGRRARSIPPEVEG